MIAKFFENDKYIRILIMIGTILVIIYNSLVFSPVGVLLEILFLISNLIGYYKHYF
ncbi:MAG: YgjV family protein [Candidatus Nanoarchaeia archaeon]